MCGAGVGREGWGWEAECGVFEVFGKQQAGCGRMGEMCMMKRSLFKSLNTIYIYIYIYIYIIYIEQFKYK